MQEQNIPPKSAVAKIALGAALIWTATLGGFLYWSIAGEIRQCTELASSQTRAFFKEFLMTRFWNTLHGGVYVPVTDNTQPNPYLKDDPNRDLITTTGMKLTKLNPAYMTRQISDVAKQKSQVVFHLTGIKPINPANAPDPWEARALGQLSDEKEQYEIIATDQGEKMFRYISPLYIEPLCIDCHSRYGDTVGSLRGGISVSIPAAPLIDSQNLQIRTFLLSYGFIWLIGILAILTCSARMQKKDNERSMIIAKLQKSLSEVKRLSGLLPICCSCKNIRDDKGYWNEVEKYMGEHADVQFTHGICPECARKLYPEFYGRKSEN